MTLELAAEGETRDATAPAAGPGGEGRAAAEVEAENIAKRKDEHNFTYTSDAGAPSLRDIQLGRRELSDVAIEYNEDYLSEQRGTATGNALPKFTVKVGALEPFSEVTHVTETVGRLFARDPEKFGTKTASGEFVNNFNENSTPEG